MDTSALVALVAGEAGSDWLVEQLAAVSSRQITAPNAVELGIVLEAWAPGFPGIATRALRDPEVDVAEFGVELFERAVVAWRRFGKGRHPRSGSFSRATRWGP